MAECGGSGICATCHVYVDEAWITRLPPPEPHELDMLDATAAERRPGSRYASLETCRMEVNEAEAMMKREGIPWLSTTTRSIEEIATTVLTLLELD